VKHLPIYNPDYRRLLSEFEKTTLTIGYSCAAMYISNVREFLFFLESRGISEVRTVKAADIVSYYEYIRERPNQRREGGLSNAMLRHHLFSLRLFFDYLTDTQQIENSPVRLPKFSIGKANERDILTLEEIKQVYNAAKTKRERAILSLAYGCGLRRSEIKDLDVVDIVLSKGMLLVRDGKNHKSRTLPLSDGVIKDLRDYLLYERPQYQQHLANAFILNDMGVRMDGNSLNTTILRIMSRTTIKKHITLHCLRHSIATHLLDKGADIVFVKNFLGHQEIDTSHLYSKRRKQRLNILNQL
jgi:integrase/recombinase XerD